MALSMDSRSSVSLPPAIQATGLLTFALAGFTLPLNTPAFSDLSAHAERSLFLDIRATRRIELICFNGQPAEKLFRRKASPLLVDLRPIPHRVLVSTSPACARISREVKLAHWRECLGPFIEGERNVIRREQWPSGL